jgi:hypothetical protein
MLPNRPQNYHQNSQLRQTMSKHRTTLEKIENW